MFDIDAFKHRAEFCFEIFLVQLVLISYEKPRHRNWPNYNHYQNHNIHDWGPSLWNCLETHHKRKKEKVVVCQYEVRFDQISDERAVEKHFTKLWLTVYHKIWLSSKSLYQEVDHNQNAQNHKNNTENSKTFEQTCILYASKLNCSVRNFLLGFLEFRFEHVCQLRWSLCHSDSFPYVF